MWLLLAALGLTIAVEGAAMLLFTRRWRFVYYSLLVNLLTNPLLNLVLLFVARSGSLPLYYVVLAALEVAVVFGEGALYAKLCGWAGKKALVVSLILNALSYGLGALVFGIWQGVSA